jgi:hypothetical protein
MSEMVYQWKDGVRAKVPAQTVGEHLEKIRVAFNGRMTPANVLSDASRSESPLHPLFEWDDKKAATQYRLAQANYIIRGIVVTLKAPGKEEPATIRAFVNVVEGKAQHYTSAAAAMTDPALREQVLKKAWDELQQWRKRYAELREFASLFATMDQLETRMSA